MLLKRFAKVILYLGLLAGALAFCSQNVLDYLDGSTDYASKQEPISLKDLPTLTFCWPLSSIYHSFFNGTKLVYENILDMTGNQ